MNRYFMALSYLGVPLCHDSLAHIACWHVHCQLQQQKSNKNDEEEKQKVFSILGTTNNFINCCINDFLFEIVAFLCDFLFCFYCFIKLYVSLSESMLM